MEEKIKFLNEALKVAGVKKLPKEVSANQDFHGKAIIKTERAGGRESYAIGEWNSKLKKIVVVQDFANTMVQKVTGIYPYEMANDSGDFFKMKVADKKTYMVKYHGYDMPDILNWTGKLLDNEYVKIQALIEKLSEKGEDNTSGLTFEQLQDMAGEGV